MGIPFRMAKAIGVPEVRKPGESPRRMVRRLAIAKAMSAAIHHPKDWVLGADTLVAQGNRILGKPSNARAAVRSLKRLQGARHEVWTGVCLVRLQPRVKRVHVERTGVSFRRLKDGEIRAYVRTGEPYDKAGGYDIQGTARHWVERWEGDFFNVMGLPIRWVLRAVKGLNLPSRT